MNIKINTEKLTLSFEDQGIGLTRDRDLNIVKLVLEYMLTQEKKL